MEKIPIKNLPAVDPTNSEQNAFVQEWLEAWRGQWEGLPAFKDVDDVVESIQETYNYQDHERRVGR